MNAFALSASLASGDTPQGKRQRQDQLRALIKAIQGAEFPRDYNGFAPFTDALRQETTAGQRAQNRWRNHVAQKHEVPDDGNPPMICPTAIFLPLLQADLAKATVRRWKQLTDGLQSPKHEQAMKEPVPAKSAALFDEAQREDELALARFGNEFTGKADYERFVEAFSKAGKSKFKETNPKARQKHAQQKQDFRPQKPTICVWSQPMTQAEYVAATGCSRKTIQRFLAKINARPTARGRHAAEPGRYSVNVNLRVLAQWIGFWVRSNEHASGLAAATIAFASAHDQSFSSKVIRALFPIIKIRKLMDCEFMDNWKAHQKLYPPLPPTLPDYPAMRLLFGSGA